MSVNEKCLRCDKAGLKTWSELNDEEREVDRLRGFGSKHGVAYDPDDAAHPSSCEPPAPFLALATTVLLQSDTVG